MCVCELHEQLLLTSLAVRESRAGRGRKVEKRTHGVDKLYFIAERL